MTTACQFVRSFRFVVLLCACLATVVPGCTRSVNLRDDLLDVPVSPAMTPPRELNKVSLPTYRIEPPDIIVVEILKLVPKPPYKADIYDVLQIRVTNTIPDQPIDNYYIVEAEGVVNLGAAYGKVRVVGMTIDEIKSTVAQSLSQMLREPDVSVQLARTSGTQQISGQYLVGPDGTINLRQYGLVHVAGLTVTEARLALQRHLSAYLDSPELSVDVQNYQSKFYYVITEGAGMGDNVRKFPITGNETVLDAIAQLGGISQLSSLQIWIARPAPGGFGCEQVMPVDWVAITKGGCAATNYQVFPGDRVYIAADDMVTLANVLNKVIAPFERVTGFLGLTGNTVNRLQTLGREYNHPVNNPNP